MYRCNICDQVSKPGHPLRRHSVLRGDGSIKREVPACEGCLKQLSAGVPLTALTRQNKPAQVPSPLPPATCEPATIIPLPTNRVSFT